MAIYTREEYDAARAALLKLTRGEKAVQVSIRGKFIRYQENQLSALQDLVNSMAINLGIAQRRAYAKHKARF